MKTMIQVVIFVVLVLGVVGGCMSMSSLNPMKKDVVLMSPLNGQVLKSGKPLADVELEVELLMPNGDKPIYRYRTDESGRFDLPVIMDAMVMGPMTEFAVSQFVSVIYNGEKREIWYAGKRNEALFGELRPAAEVIGLKCDLDMEEYNNTAEDHGSILTICTWDSIKYIDGNG